MSTKGKSTSAKQSEKKAVISQKKLLTTPIAKISAASTVANDTDIIQKKKGVKTGKSFHDDMARIGGNAKRIKSNVAPMSNMVGGIILQTILAAMHASSERFGRRTIKAADAKAAANAVGISILAPAANFKQETKRKSALKKKNAAAALAAEADSTNTENTPSSVTQNLSTQQP